MKKLITFFVLTAMISSLLSAQTFEHLYNGQGSIYKVSPTIYVYGVLATGGTSYNIYSMNHTLIKTINLSTTAIGILNLSQTMFNSDNKYELTYQYSGGVKVVDEDNATLLDEVGAAYASFFNTDQGAKMLTIFSSPAKTNVYSMVGQVFLVPIIDDESSNIFSFPNPAKSSITISYNIPDGFSYGDLVIYNLNGVEIKRYKVDRYFNDININTSEFSSGTYLYKVISVNKESQTKKFIIE